MYDQRLFSRSQIHFHSQILYEALSGFAFKHSMCFIKCFGAVIRKLSFMHLKPSICFAVVLRLEYSDVCFKESIIKKKKKNVYRARLSRWPFTKQRLIPHLTHKFLNSYTRF